MYEELFHFHHRPFGAAPQVERYYPAASIEQARKTVSRCIERAEGAALAIGQSGTGKTLLCQVLARQFSARFQTAVLTCGNLGTRRALLQAVLFELDLPYRGLDDGELRLSLIDHLVQNTRDSAGLVLFVDEAHTLSWRLLEELRLITNVAAGGEPRVRMVLAGNAALEELFAHPKLDSFSQRVAARCYLGGLDRAETAAYIRHQIAMCGGNPDTVIALEALESVYRATEGIPRLINQVCDHALILASLADQRTLQKATIDEAWADLQQLPVPWAGGGQLTGPAGSGVVEFGSLDDADEQASAAADNLDDVCFEEDRFHEDDEDDYDLRADDDHDDDATRASDLSHGHTKQRVDAGQPAMHEAGRAFDDTDDAPEAIPFRRMRTDSADLEKQFNAIDGHLADYEDDFQPAGLIGPEVELVYTDSTDPFQEQFAEEEVIVDRYAAIDTGSFAGLPTVTSVEGRELGSRLAAVARSVEPLRADRPAEPRIVVDVFAGVPQTSGTHPAAVAHVAAGPAEIPVIQGLSVSWAATATEPPGNSAWPATHSQIAVSDKGNKHSSHPAGPDGISKTGPALVPPRNAHRSLRPEEPLRPDVPPREGTVSGETDVEDRDQIVIDEDPPTPGSRQQSLVRRQEYRQLFAKLRRG